MTFVSGTARWLLWSGTPSEILWQWRSGRAKPPTAQQQFSTTLFEVAPGLKDNTTPGIQWQSSAGRPVLNAQIQDQIVVPDSGATIVIDYDVGKAFITPQDVNPASTDQGFIFSPVLRAIDKQRSSSIAGMVRARSATGAPVANASLRLYLGNPNNAENTWGVIATAKSDASGAFRFAYIPRSSVFTQPGVSYIVAADPPTGSGLGRQIVINVSAKAGVETSVGVVILP